MSNEKTADIKVGDKFIADFDFEIYGGDISYQEGEELIVESVFKDGVNLSTDTYPNIGWAKEDIECYMTVK